MPEIEAAPPTSKRVSVAPPALMPKRAVAEVSSKFPATEALLPNKVRPDIDAVPPTSSLVSIVPPLLIPKLPADNEALAPKVHLPVMVWAIDLEAGPLA